MVGERRSSRKRAGRLRYDPQCGGGPSGVIREPTVPFTWRGSEYRSRRVCAGVGSGLEPQCLRRPSVGGSPRGDEESGKPNADNNFDALHRGWRGARVTYIASRSCNGFSTTVRAPTWSVGRGGQPEVDALARLAVPLPVRRLTLPELLKQSRGRHVRTRTVWRDRMARRRRQRDLLAVPAARFLPHRLNHDSSARDDHQSLGHVLADLAPPGHSSHKRPRAPDRSMCLYSTF